MAEEVFTNNILLKIYFKNIFLEISSKYISGGSEDDREDEHAHSRHHHHQWHRHEGKL